MKAYRLWPAIAAAVAVISLLLGCNGSGEQDGLLGAPGERGSPVGTWFLNAIGDSWDGPWRRVVGLTNHGTWTIERHPRTDPTQSGHTSDGTWTRTLKLRGRPYENTTGEWGASGDEEFSFSEGGVGRTGTTFYLRNDKLLYAIDEPGVFTGVVEWRRK